MYFTSLSVYPSDNRYETWSVDMHYTVSLMTMSVGRALTALYRLDHRASTNYELSPSGL